MRKILQPLVLFCLILLLSGCSFAYTYLVRNFSDKPVEILLTITGQDETSVLTDLEITMADRIVVLEKSEISESFTNKLIAVKDADSVYRFVLPAGHSANIDRLITQLNPGRSYESDFKRGKIELRSGKTALLFGNDLAEIQSIFKFKSFFIGGPRVYYIDLK